MQKRTPRSSPLTRLGRAIERAATVLFARSDARARASGWEVRSAGRWSTSRVYHDPRYDRLASCPRCGGHGCPRCSQTGRITRPTRDAPLLDRPVRDRPAYDRPAYDRLARDRPARDPAAAGWSRPDPATPDRAVPQRAAVPDWTARDWVVQDRAAPEWAARFRSGPDDGDRCERAWSPR